MNDLIRIPRARLILDFESGIPPDDLLEVVVRKPPRSGFYLAVYTGPNGGQVARSTGLRDREAALALALRWERAARVERETQRAAGGQVRRRTRGDALMTQDQVARIMGLSTRGVRSIEARALRKLRRLLGDIMDEELKST